MKNFLFRYLSFNQVSALLRMVSNIFKVILIKRQQVDIDFLYVYYLQWILHSWSDEECIQILRNCKKAIPRENGKVIIVEIILKEDGSGVFDEIGFLFDLVMMTHANGKERTEVEWKKILEGGGFSHHKIINIPALVSIIEAYPDDE